MLVLCVIEGLSSPPGPPKTVVRKSFISNVLRGLSSPIPFFGYQDPDPDDHAALVIPVRLPRG